MALEYFPCYHSYFKKCEKLTDQELGRLFRALLKYSETGERQELAGRESIAFDFIADDIDRAKQSYDDRCKTNRENVKKRYDGTTVYDGIQSYTTVYESYQNKDKDKDKNKNKDNSPNGESIPAHAKHRTYGQYGWVRLTDDEYKRLLDEFGEVELLRCINYVDESAQATGNKNKWKDWNLVIRKCHRQNWGVSADKPTKMQVSKSQNPTKESIDEINSFIASMPK